MAIDWDRIYHPVAPKAPPPQPELVEACWRMRSLQKATRVLACGVYRTAFGLELRAGYGEDDLLRSQRVREIEAGRELAECWRQTVIAKGGFSELPTDDYK